MIMSEYLFGAICFAALALCLLYRLIAGPSVVDRALSADMIDTLTDMALILYAMYTGRSIFLDIAFITALLGFVGSTVVARYLGGKL